MPVLRNIRFRNFDNYNKPVFITYDSRNPNYDDKDNYNNLKEITYKLQGLGYESDTVAFFQNEELKFATITIERTNFNTEFLEPGVYYHIDYKMKIKDKGSPNAPTGLGEPLGGKASDGATNGKSYINLINN